MMHFLVLLAESAAAEIGVERHIPSALRAAVHLPLVADWAMGREVVNREARLGLDESYPLAEAYIVCC
jgi:hypothetical protein